MSYRGIWYTLNGIVFYSNMVQINRHIFFPLGETNILTQGLIQDFFERAGVAGAKLSNQVMTIPTQGHAHCHISGHVTCHIAKRKG